MTCGLIFWLIFGLTVHIEPVEAFQTLRSSATRQKILKNFRLALKVTFIGFRRYLLIFVLMGGLIGGLNSGLGVIIGVIIGVISMILGLILGLIGSLIGGLISALKQELNVRTRPNQGIWNSLKIMFWTTIFSYPLCVILGMATFLIRSLAKEETNHNWLNILSTAFPYSLKFGPLYALTFALIIGFCVGGVACVQHFCLRFVLWQSGTIPWNFARFLNYCVERRLLLRIGGRYRFLHRELLDHFAQSGS